MFRYQGCASVSFSFDYVSAAKAQHSQLLALLQCTPYMLRLSHAHTLKSKEDGFNDNLELMYSSSRGGDSHDTL